MSVNNSTVEVNVDFIKKAYKAACNTWKMELINQFPELELSDGYKMGDFVKSKTTELVVLVTQPSIDKNSNFTGVVVIPDERHKLGYVTNEWVGSKGEPYVGEPIDINTVLKIKK
jgi:hypothetical protein